MGEQFIIWTKFEKLGFFQTLLSWVWRILKAVSMGWPWVRRCVVGCRRQMQEVRTNFFRLFRQTQMLLTFWSLKGQKRKERKECEKETNSAEGDRIFFVFLSEKGRLRMFSSISEYSTRWSWSRIESYVLPTRHRTTIKTPSADGEGIDKKEHNVFSQWAKNDINFINVFFMR